MCCSVPGREIIVSHEQGRDRRSAPNAYAVLKEAFPATQQRLKDFRRLQVSPRQMSPRQMFPSP